MNCTMTPQSEHTLSWAGTVREVLVKTEQVEDIDCVSGDNSSRTLSAWHSFPVALLLELQQAVQ